MKTFSDVIDAFGGLGPFSAETGIKYNAASAMKQRNSVPPEHWKMIEAHALRLGIKKLNRYTLCDMMVAKSPDVLLPPFESPLEDPVPVPTPRKPPLKLYRYGLARPASGR